MDYGYGNQQYSTTTYGANGGTGGGGFLNNGSQEAGGKEKGYGKDTLRPVTIKQLIDSEQPHPDAEFRIDGTEVTQVTFVGQIRNISQQATNYTYKLDDGTGTIEVKQWIDPEVDGPDGDNSKNKLTESAYARVYGRMKAFNNKRHVGATTIRAIPNLNEVQYHLLEATMVHLHYTRGPLTSAAGANGANGQQQNGASGGYADVSGDGKGMALPAGLSSGAKKVYNCLHSVKEINEGLHVQDIAVRLGMDIADANKAGDELQNQGLIYTTVDDHTWAILDT